MPFGELPVWFVRVFAFAFGALWGSFANVVIYRWPREESVVRPGSHCTVCNNPVRAYDNVPIFAWFWLRGRCRECGAPFSFRYPLVESLFAIVSTAIAERLMHGEASTLPAWQALALYFVRFSVAFALLVATFIDLDEMIVPWFVKWFAIVPLAAAWFLPVTSPAVDGLWALVGAGVGYLGLRILFVDGYKLLAGRRGMGIGDAEILLLVGALLGVPGVLFALGAGAVQGVIVTGVALLFGARIGPEHADDVDESDDEDGDETDQDGDARADDAKGEDEGVDVEVGARRKMKVPFVPFLALAALEYMLGADVLVRSYLNWLRGT